MWLNLSCQTLASAKAIEVSSALQIGLSLMIVGMSVVFVALVIIGAMMRWTSIICDKWLPSETPESLEAETSNVSQAVEPIAQAQPEPITGNPTLAAITAAAVCMLGQNLRVKRVARIPGVVDTASTRWATMGRMIHQGSHNLRR